MAVDRSPDDSPPESSLKQVRKSLFSPPESSQRVRSSGDVLLSPVVGMLRKFQSVDVLRNASRVSVWDQAQTQRKHKKKRGNMGPLRIARSVQKRLRQAAIFRLDRGSL